MELSVLKCVSIGVMIVACGLPTFVFVTVAVSTCTSLDPRHIVTFVIVVIVEVRKITDRKRDSCKRHTNIRQIDEWLREKRKEEQKTRSNGQTGTNGQTDHKLTHKKERKGKQSVG